MVEKSYNIHNFVKFKIITPDTNTWRFINIFGSFENFKVDTIDDCDFVVTLGKFKPQNDGCSISEGKYHIRKNYFLCTDDSYKMAKWSFEVLGLDDQCTTVKISSNVFGYLWMSGFIIEFLIHFKLNRKGISIVHASGLTQNRQGILFSARGGGGKTSIALNLLDHGYKLLGDNFVILKDGEIFSYLSPLNIFFYNLTGILKQTITGRSKIDLKFKYMFYIFTNKNIKIFSKINPKRLFPDKIAEESGLNQIILLVPKEKFEGRKITKAALLKKLQINQLMDTLFFTNYIFEYSYFFPDSPLSHHWDTYLENLDKNIPDDCKCKQAEVSPQYSNDQIQKTMRLINE